MFMKISSTFVLPDKTQLKVGMNFVDVLQKVKIII